MAVSGAFKKGFYTGIGANWSQIDASQSVEQYSRGGIINHDPQRVKDRKFKKSAFSPNVFLGYRYRKGNHPWTIALEISMLFGKAKAEINTMEPHHQNYIDTSIERNFASTLQLKPGYVFREKYLFYGIIGACFDRYKWNYRAHIYYNDYRYNDKKLLPGLVLGVGIERARKRTHVGIQTNYILYNNKTFEGSTMPGYIARMRVKPHIFQVTLYLSYVF